MKLLKIRYTKELMLDIDNDATNEDIRELIEILATEEVFQDGEYDEVEWEVF